MRLLLEVRELERHRLGSQTFLPLGGRLFVVVVVALGADAPKPATLAAFRGAPGRWATCALRHRERM